MHRAFVSVEAVALHTGVLIIAAVVATRSDAAAPAVPDKSERSHAAPGGPKLPEVRREKIIELSVVAATDGKPIERFRIVSGTPFPRGMVADVRSTAQWQPHTLRIGKNGRLDWPLPGWDELILRVEADGYQMQCSKWIKKGAEQSRLEFRLAQDWGVWGRVLEPDGKPAAGAHIGMTIPHQYLAVENGKIRIANQPPPKTEVDRWRLPKLVDADTDGRFVLPYETDSSAMVTIVHESGQRRIPYAEFQRQPEVTLPEWGRVEGRILWGDKPGANQKVMLGDRESRTDKDGRFVFERVAPGRLEILQPIELPQPRDDGISSVTRPGLSATIDVKPSVITRALLGGRGRTVRGRLTDRESWDGVTMHFHPNAPHVSDTAGWQAHSMFRQSSFGQLFFREGLKPNADGTFEIPHMLPGDYQLFVSAPGYYGSKHFHIDAESPDQVAPPLDLGEIKAGPRFPVDLGE
jgi:hypothetical protein